MSIDRELAEGLRQIGRRKTPTIAVLSFPQGGAQCVASFDWGRREPLLRGGL